LWSKRSPFGSIRWSPCRSNTDSNSRSVAANTVEQAAQTHIRDFGLGHAVQRTAQIVCVASKILAKPLTAYFWVSVALHAGRAAGTFSVFGQLPAAAGPWYRPASPSSVRNTFLRRAAPPSSGKSPAISPASLAGRASRRSLSSIIGPYPISAPIILAVLIHHRDDAGIVDRVADDPDRADDPLAAVLIRPD